MSGRPTHSIRSLMPWVLGHARRHPLPLAVVTGATGASVVLGLLKPWPMVLLIDYALRGGQMPDWLAELVSWVPGDPRMTLVSLAVLSTILLFLLDWLTTLVTSYASVTLTQRLNYDVAGSLFQKLQQLSLGFHRARSSGDMIRRVTKDSGCVSTILISAVVPVVKAAGTLLLMLIILAQIHLGLTLLTLVIIPYMALVFRLYAKAMQDRSYEEQENEARVYEVVERTFSGIPAVQAFGREPLNEEMFRRTTSRTLTAALHVLSAQLQFKILMGLATASGTAAVLWIGGLEALAGELTIGTIVLFLSYLASLYAPLEAVMYSGSIVHSAAGSARRVLDVLHAAPDVRDAPHAVALTRVRGELRFEGVSYEHQPGRRALDDVSLDVAAGETIALVGPTGAGKTTLVSLVARFFDPTHGRVLLDGRDLREIQVKSLREHISVVLQEPFLFPMTVAENIAYGRPGVSRAEIEAAARAANAHEFISRLPQGYDTVLAERAATLSGGEKQRISIARALVRGAPIVIFDEPTSAVDAVTEAAIAEAMRNLVRDRTTFIIAHRLSTIRHADRIVVLQDGAIAEVGSHSELIARDGLYARYARAQFLAEPAQG